MGACLVLLYVWCFKNLLYQFIIPAFVRCIRKRHNYEVDEDNLDTISETDTDEILEDIKAAEIR
jgi:hypothetical protein